MIVHMTWPPINFILEPSGSLVSHLTVALHFPFAHLEIGKDNACFAVKFKRFKLKGF